MILTNEIIKQKKNRQKKTKKIFKIIVLPIFAIIILFIIYTAYLEYIKKENDINLFGFRIYMVMTGSMEPTYNIGDMIIIRETKIEDIKVNDVITYTIEDEKNTITHRISEIIEQDGEKVYITKGDNNNSNDTDSVSYNQIRGVVLFKISKMGTIITSLLTGTGIITIIILIISFYMHDIRKEEKRIAREDTRKIHNIPKYEKEDDK